MKHYLFLIWLFLAAMHPPALSQDRTIDSLQRLVRQAPHDSIKARLLVSIGSEFHFRFRKLDSAFLYYEEALNLARKQNLTQLQLRAVNRIANITQASSNYSEALRMLLENLELEERIRDTNEIFFTKREIMWVYSNMGDQKKELELARELTSFVTSGYFKDPVAINRLQNTAYNILSNAFLHANAFDSSLYYRMLLINRTKQSKDPIWMALSSHSLAELYMKLNKWDSAFKYSRLCILYGGLTNRADISTEGHMYLARLFQKRGQRDSAFYYARNALHLYKNVPDTGGMMRAARVLSDLHKDGKRFDSAFYFLSYHTALKDSSLADEKIKKAQTLLFNETLRQQQRQQERKEAQQRYKTNLQVYGLTGGLLVIALVAFFLYRNSRQRKKANALLQVKNQQIESTLTELKATQAQLIQSEKMASLGELTAGIAHEIQNPLNFVNNFSETNAELTEELEKELDDGNFPGAKQIADDIKQNNVKINYHGKRAEAIVSNMLQHSRSSKGERQETDLNAMVEEYLRLAYQGFRAKDKTFNAIIETRYDETMGKVSLVPQDIGRVLLNLFNNAFYAVAEKEKSLDEEYKPIVTVTSKRLKNIVEIIVQDNGMGISKSLIDKIFQPFFTTKTTGQGTGLGLSLSYDIIKAHGGELQVESTEGEGATFTLQLPA